MFVPDKDGSVLETNDLDKMDKSDPSVQIKQKAMNALMKTVPEALQDKLAFANNHHLNGDLEKASALYKELLVQCPNSAFVLFCLGTLLCNAAEHALGITCLMRSLEFMPDNPEGWNNLGTAFKHEHQDASAEECFKRSIECDPYCGGTYANLSGVYINNGCPDKAIETARKAMTFPDAKDLSQAHNHLALALLEKGEFDEGFAEYEHRRFLPEWPGRQRNFGLMVRWQGERINPYDKLLITGEQGVGDEILFAQCIANVLTVVPEHQLVIEMNDQVTPAFRRTWPKAKVYDQFDHAVQVEGPTHYIEIGSLGYLYRRDRELFDGRPYMRVDPDRVAYWRQRLEATGPGPYIGFAWRGGVKKTARHLREFPLELAKPLVRRPGTFVSVQYGPHASEAGSVGLSHWPEQAYNLDERYHLIAACDLVMTVCQTAFHQAGSIGKDVWCFVPSRPAWRYNLTGEQSVWYDSATLLRQRGDDWRGLIHRAGIRYDAWLKEWRKRNAKTAEKAVR